jgi:hypothetical protein
MANINQLPYFQIPNTKETNKIARFLLKKIKRVLEEKNPYHYLIFARQDKQLKYIQKMSRSASRRNQYFLRIDIEKYYPSINHKVLLEVLEKELFKNKLSHRLRKIIRKEIPLLLKKSPIKNLGLPLGNYLSWVLAGFYLLPLDLKIPKPFLRIQDDYLIFCEDKKEPEKILKEIIEPVLDKLKLNLNINKLNSGKFHQSSVEFMGFKYYAGVFTISEKKIEEFKKRIIKITHLTKKKSYKAIVKLLNNKILGFGHYYKLSSCKQDFEKLDSFIRMRLRRYLSRNKNSKSREGNLLLTNSILKNLGLKSLLKVKEKYDTKKRHISQKKTKSKLKTCNIEKNFQWQEIEQKGHYYEQKAILKQLQELTKNMKKLEKKISKIDKKLENG